MSSPTASACAISPPSCCMKWATCWAPGTIRTAISWRRSTTAAMATASIAAPSPWWQPPSTCRSASSTGASGPGWRTPATAPAATRLVAERRHDVLAEAAHRGDVLGVAHRAKAGLAKQVPDADVAQFRHLFAHAPGRAVERAGLESEGNGLGVGYLGIGPGIEHGGIRLEVGRIVGFPHVHHVRAGVGQQRGQLILGLRVGLRDVDVAPERALGEQPRLGRRIMPAFVDPLGVGRPALLDARHRQPCGQDRHAEPAAFLERAGRNDAAPQRRAGLLHRLGPDSGDADLVELAVIAKRRLAPGALEDVEGFLHALAAVVAAQAMAHELILV